MAEVISQSLGGGLKQPSTCTAAPVLDKINSINDFIVHQSRSIPDTPLIAYPASDSGAGDFVNYSAKELDLLADHAAQKLASQGLIPKNAKTSKAEVVGLLGPSDVNYIIAVLALSRMGFSVLFLSTRLPTEAYVALLKETDCTRIVSGSKLGPAVHRVRELYEVETFPIPNHIASARAPQSPTATRFQRQVELQDEENTVAFIVHSSGSTGLPKPIYQTHRQCLSNYATGIGMRAFVTLPLFHNHGIATMFRGMVTGKRTAIYNANLPLTNQHLVTAMKAADYESFHCVPYALKVLAETPEGVAELAKAKLVLFGGSSCPDDLGDLLVQNGVNIVSHYGATEMGQLMTSQRDPKSDKAWNWVRPLAKTKPYLFFDEITTGIFEVVVLDGLSTKTMSNSDDPPNSYRTRDTFIKHPTMPDAWKYLGRLDDRVTLWNGEKVLPIPFEHRVRQNELVQDCLVFGVGRAFPGLLIIPSAHAVDKSATELLDLLWSDIEDANSKAEQFGRVSREMVKIMSVGTEYPRTDKGTVIRAASYKHFEAVIEEVYQKFDAPSAAGNGAVLDVPELEIHLERLFTEILGVADLGRDTDFFAAGIDSLQAITARARVVREINLDGKKLGHNVVFDHPTVARLARYLHSLRAGAELEQKAEVDIMHELVAKYSTFEAFNPGSQTPDSEVVLLTGATGSLGAHALSQLLSLPHIRHVHCLVRASTSDEARQRVLDSLDARGLSLTQENIAKFTALPSDLSTPNLGLDKELFDTIRSTLTLVIHSAWAVNFTIKVQSFEAQHIAGLRHLLDLCLSVPFTQPARLFFISSISAAAGTPSPATIAETFVADAENAQNMGYARSKWVAEHIVRAAARSTGMQARVLRSGQIIGDSSTGRWNPTEAIPLMFRAATTIGALPELDETPSWLPVDVCARAVLELSDLTSDSRQQQQNKGNDSEVVYHVQNPTLVRWTEDILPAAAKAGLEFETVGRREWVQRLRDSEPDPRLNPTIKLLDFFADKYDNDKPGRSGLLFDTRKTEARSQAIRGGYDVVTSGLLAKCIACWKREWS